MPGPLLLRRLCTWLFGRARRGLAVAAAGVVALALGPLTTLAQIPDAPRPQDPFTLGGHDSMGPPAVAVDEQGFSHIVWTAGNQVYYQKVSEQLRYAADWTLADPGLPGADPASPPEPEPLVIYEALPALQAKVATDRAGNAHIVVWSQGHAFSGFVYIKVGADGVKRTHELLRMKPLPSGDVQYSWPGIAIDPVTDLPVVIGIAQVTNETPASLDYINFYPGLGILSFLTLYPIYIPAVSIYREYVVALRLGPAGTVTNQHVFWSERQGGSLPNRSTAPAVAVDLGGRLHAVWRCGWRSGPSDVVYRNSAQSGSDIDSLYYLSASVSGGWARTAPAVRPAIVRDSRDALHVVWHTDEARCAYARLSTEGDLLSEASPGSDDARVTGPPAVAVGPDGIARVVWEDARDGDDEIYFAAIGGDTGEVLSPPAAAGAEDCRLSFSSGSAFAPAIGVSPWGQPSIVWKDTAYPYTAYPYVDYTLAKYRPAWTWLLYVNGDNELADSCLAALNGAADGREHFLGLEEAAYLPLARLLVQIDGPGQNDTRRLVLGYDGNRTESLAALSNRYQAYLGRACWYVGPAGAGTDPTAAEANMADPAALRDFLTWAEARYPGGQTLLSVVSPGSGWLPGAGAGARDGGGTRAILPDQNGTPANPADDSAMGMRALRLALDNADKPYHYDLLFLDASCSGLLEVAYQVRPYADLLLLSQGSSTPGPYGSYLVALANAAGASPLDPAEETPVAPLEVAKALVAQHHTYAIEAEATGLLRQHTLAALRSSRLDALWESVDALVASEAGLRAFPDLKETQIWAWVNSQRTDDEGRYTDLASFCAQLGLALGDDPGLTALRELARAVEGTLGPVGDDRLVVANAHDDRLMAECAGLSIYFPFYRPDLAVGGTPEADEEAPGASVPLAEGDEEGGSKAAVNRGADVPVVIRFPGADPRGTLVLERTNRNIGVGRRDPATGALTPVFTPASPLRRPWDLSKPEDRLHLQDLRGKLVCRGLIPGECGLTMTYTGAADPFTDHVNIVIVDVNCLVDSKNDGRITREDDGAEETAPGLILSWNNDSDDGDENGNGEVDAAEIDRNDALLDGATDKADMATLALHLGPNTIPKTAHIELVVSDPTLVRVFDESYTAILGASVPGKPGPVATWESTLTSLPLPERNAGFHIEGVKPGTLELSFRLKNKKGKVVAQDQVKITVLGLDLLVDSNNSGTPDDADDPNEEASPGKVIPANLNNDGNDDDSGNGAVDKDDNDTLDLAIDGASDAADLATLVLRFVPAGLSDDYSVELKVDDPYKVRIFDDAAQPVIGPWIVAGEGSEDSWKVVPAAFAAPRSERRFQIEGVAPGEVTLKLIFATMAGRVIGYDTVKLSVLKLGFHKAPTEDAGGNRYGYDDWDLTPSHRQDYVSVKTNDSTKVQVTADGLADLTLLSFKSVDRGIAEVGAIPAGAVPSGFLLDVTGKGTGSVETVIQAFVGRTGKMLCNELRVLVQEQWEVAEFKVYRVTDPGSPTTAGLTADSGDRTKIKDFCNRISKYAVLKFTAVEVADKEITYDVSPKNGCMDYYYDGSDQPELDLVKTAGLGGDPKAAIFKSVNFAWRLKEPAARGDTKLVMRGVSYINDWLSFTYQLGSGATQEPPPVTVVRVSGNELTLAVPLQYPHPVDEVLITTGGGAADDPQVVKDGPDVLNTLLHECLHRDNVGRLTDLKDYLNIMGGAGEQLRRKALAKRYEAGDEEQWLRPQRPPPLVTTPPP